MRLPQSIHRLHLGFVCRVVGYMSLAQILPMLICLSVALYFGESVRPYLLGAMGYSTLGFLLTKLSGETLDYSKKRIGRREGMLSVTLTWLMLSLVATIPLIASEATDAFSSAFFEAVSGFTTTGATVFEGIDHLPKSILMFRSLMQWQGGIGIVVFTIAFIPIFGGGASQIFNAESTGITHDRFLPRISDVAKRIIMVYVGETLLLFLILWLGPMAMFDALCHSLTCISTGGYANHNMGIEEFNSAYIEYTLAVFMYLGSLNIALVYFLVMGKPLKLIADEEFRWFSAFILIFTLITVLWLLHLEAYPSLEMTIRKAFFQVVSLASSTGYVTVNITDWQPFFWMIAILLMFVNGCAGSTSGGLKMGRFMILIKNLNNEFRKQIHPHLLTPVVINGRQVKASVVHQVLAFCVLYIILIFVGSMLVMLDGHGFAESITIATSCISNSGAGIGQFASNLAQADEFTKFSLSALMLAGRLEAFTFIGILTPFFWRH